jgi:hypothetical protein
LLCAFSLFLLAGSGLVIKLISAAFGDYFSTVRQLERSVLFYRGKHARLDRLFLFKKARLLYFNQQQRKQLLKKDAWNSMSS